jgi:glycosyltransferase involved in cell wall biosynthesis
MTASVCIPAYNSASYVRECIESVLAQTYQDFELIISDNCSTDRTWEIVQSYSDPRIRLTRADQNRGMAHNFNQAVGMARGEYLKILCSDDVLHPRALELQAKFLDEHQDAVLVTCARQFIDAQGRDLQIVRWFSRDIVLRGVDLKTVILLYGNVIGEPSATLTRREAVVRAGPFKDGLSTAIDLEMWLRVLDQGPGGYMASSLCSIRRHPGMATQKYRKEGHIQDAVLRLTADLLGTMETGPLVRTIGFGRLAGAFVKHALYGFAHGSFKGPLLTFWRAFKLDPGFLGLLIYLMLFRPGILGLAADEKGRTRVHAGGTLRSLQDAVHD